MTRQTWRKIWIPFLIVVLVAWLICFLYEKQMIDRQVELAEMKVRDHLERVSFDLDGEIWTVSVEDPGLSKKPSDKDDTTSFRPEIRAESSSGQSLTYVYPHKLYVDEEAFETVAPS